MQAGYRFHVRGHLDDHWAAWLGGLAIERKDDGSSVLSGPIADQAALHGVIGRIRDLGLPLLAVECVGDECDEVSRCFQAGARGSPRLPGVILESQQPLDRITQAANDIEGDQPCD